MDFRRSAKGIWWRFLRRRTLSQRFLLTSVVVISLAMLGLGWWIGHFVQQSITRGVAETAAASVDSLLAHAVREIELDESLDDEELARLNDAFAVAAQSGATPLYNVRIRSLAGDTVYEADSEFIDDADQSEDFAAATRGTVRVRLIRVDLPAIGTLPSYPVDVLEIYSPLRSATTGEVIAVAELYFSADAVGRLRDEAQQMVWLLVGVFGVAVVAALYWFVDRATRTIARQRQRLGAELAATRRLSGENLRLRNEAEELRRQATTANEALLAHIGSDIHDGPMQLLTLTILKLTRARTSGATGLDPSIEAVTEALTDLRRISTGLVLPELADATLAEAIELAVKRHEDITGTSVARAYEGVDVPAAPSIKVTSYRVVQEALTNAFRHGGGSGQGVRASLHDGVLALTVENDSADVALASGEHDNKLGIRGMRFRVESVGGRLDVRLGRPRSKVTATIPVTPGFDAPLLPGS